MVSVSEITLLHKPGKNLCFVEIRQSLDPFQGKYNLYYNNCTAAPSEVQKAKEKKKVLAAGSDSQMFLRPEFTSNASVTLITTLERKLGFLKITTRLEAQIPQAKGKVAPEKQKDFVLTWSSHTSKQGSRRQPASGDGTNASCSSTRSVPTGRAPLLGIFRRAGGQEKGAWREKPGDRKFLQCQELFHHSCFSLLFSESCREREGK